MLNEKEGLKTILRRSESVGRILSSESLLVYYENEIERWRGYFYIDFGVILFFVHCNKGNWGKKSIGGFWAKSSALFSQVLFFRQSVDFTGFVELLRGEDVFSS